MAQSWVPHPFDSHPTLAERLVSLGFDPAAVTKSPGVLPDVENSWFSAIHEAGQLEAEQWKVLEESFHQAHEDSLVYRFEPCGEAEIRLVEKHFPRIEFQGSNGLAATLDHKSTTSD